MKKILFSLAILMSALCLFGQNNDLPSYGYKYQAIIRDINGGIAKNQPVQLRFQVLNSADQLQYEETHATSTDLFGRVEVTVGKGVGSFGKFDTIGWGARKHLVEISLKLNGVMNWVSIGKEEIVLMPAAGESRDWIRSGQNLLNLSDGNLGIGWSDPLSKLTIAGDLHLGGSRRLYFQGGPSDPNYFIESYPVPGSAALRIKGFGGVNIATLSGDILHVESDRVGVGTSNLTGKLTLAGDFTMLHPADPEISGGKVLQLDFMPSFGPQTGAMGFRMTAAYPHASGWNSGPRIDVLAYDGNTFLGTDINGTPLGYVGIGTRTPQSRLHINGDMRCKTAIIEGNDRTEYVLTVNDQPLAPGTVVVYDEIEEDRIRPCNSAYDHKIPGIVSDLSDSGKYHPGIIHVQEGTEKGAPVALGGKVEALAIGPVAVGDYLTTSAVTGHAMAAKKQRKAQGAIIGRATTSLKKGEKGKVVVLVTERR